MLKQKDKTIYLPESKYNYLRIVKTEYEKRLNKNVSWGDFLVGLATGAFVGFIAANLARKSKVKEVVMPKSSQPFFNVRVIEEVKGKKEANKYLELGWKLLGPPLVKKEGGPDYGFDDVSVYPVGWCSGSLRTGMEPPRPENKE